MEYYTQGLFSSLIRAHIDTHTHTHTHTHIHEFSDVPLNMEVLELLANILPVHQKDLIGVHIGIGGVCQMQGRRGNVAEGQEGVCICVSGFPLHCLLFASCANFCCTFLP